jgi:hypothetical protein
MEYPPPPLLCVHINLKVFGWFTCKSFERLLDLIKKLSAYCTPLEQWL